MAEKLGFKSKIPTGDYKGMTVKKALEEDCKAVFNLIKKGILFEDEVLEECGIKHSVYDKKAKYVFVEHEVDNKVYVKDTATLHTIMKEISNIEKADTDVPRENAETMSDNGYGEE